MDVPDRYAAYHEEVTEALRAIGDAEFGARVRRDRGSELDYFGILNFDRRCRVKEGFSFYVLPEEQVLDVWNALWRTSANGDVLFAALDYYRPIVRRRVSPALWPVVRTWIDRVDNWAHADELAGLYSWVLAARPEEVYPSLRTWSWSSELWERRISIVSLIHYTGKNAVFLSPERVLPLVSNCLEDDRFQVQMAVGWVLREMGHVYPSEIAGYLEENAARIGTRALARAIERCAPEEQARLRALRKAAPT